MRVLDRSVVALDVDNLGFARMRARRCARLLELPNGIVLVTGPTGFGQDHDAVPAC